MDHLEAQSLIISYVNNTLPRNKQEDFALHMQNCPSCYNELEIYYTLFKGTNAIEKGKDLPADFDKQLRKELSDTRKKTVRKRRLFAYSFTLVFIAVSIFIIIFYIQSLDRVYDYEQQVILDAQSEYYFDAALYDKLCYIPFPDRVKESNDLTDQKPTSFYEKIRIYNEYHHPSEDDGEENTGEGGAK